MYQYGDIITPSRVLHQTLQTQQTMGLVLYIDIICRNSASQSVRLNDTQEN